MSEPLSQFNSWPSCYLQGDLESAQLPQGADWAAWVTRRVRFSGGVTHSQWALVGCSSSSP